MELKRWKQYCLCSLGGSFPEDVVPTQALFAPLVLLVHRDPQRSRGCFAVSSMAQVLEPEDTSVLLPCPAHESVDALHAFVAANGATVLNTAFGRAFDWLAAPRPRDGFRITLAGLGDVGSTLLTALKLLGNSLKEIRIYDPNEAQCRRYEMELNQVLERPTPRVSLAAADTLFDCDLFLFTASRGVPPVGAAVQDVRLVQFERNRQMLTAYANQAREIGFNGLFCQISDPVDLLCRTVFLDSNRDASGCFDAMGLLPEQIQGFGLGVMAARAAYYAEKNNIDFSDGRAYGPHGADLIIADHPINYHPDISAQLTALTVQANLQVRALGFKPYIAPALSSAALSILQLLRGEAHYGAVPMGGAYFGCRSRFTAAGLLTEREALHPVLYERIRQVHARLEGFHYDPCCDTPTQ